MCSVIYLFINLLTLQILKRRFGPTVRLAISIPSGAGLSHENSLSKNGGKVVYILPSSNPALAGASCTRSPLTLKILHMCYNECHERTDSQQLIPNCVMKYNGL